MARWRVAVDLLVGGLAFHKDATLEAPNLEALIDSDADDVFGSWADEIEGQLELDDITQLQFTVERLP